MSLGATQYLMQQVYAMIGESGQKVETFCSII